MSEPVVVIAGDDRRTHVRDIREFWHVVQAPPSLLKRLEPAYYVFITLAIGGPFVYGTASSALSEVATPRTVGIWGPSLALVALLAVTRWGAVQGPVISASPTSRSCSARRCAARNWSSDA
jgi:hypothetical protein